MYVEHALSLDTAEFGEKLNPFHRLLDQELAGQVELVAHRGRPAAADQKCLLLQVVLVDALYDRVELEVDLLLVVDELEDVGLECVEQLDLVRPAWLDLVVELGGFLLNEIIEVSRDFFELP